MNRIRLHRIIPNVLNSNAILMALDFAAIILGTAETTMTATRRRPVCKILRKNVLGALCRTVKRNAQQMLTARTGALAPGIPSAARRSAAPW